MKKHLVLFSIFVIFAAVMLSCSKQAVVEDISTTAIADSEGVTHYYEIITDEFSESTTLIEIVTKQNGKAVTDSQGHYVTVQHTASAPQIEQNENTTDNLTINNSSSSSTSSHQKSNDNDIPFEPSDKNGTEYAPSTTNNSSSSEKEPSKKDESESTSTTSNSQSSEKGPSENNNDQTDEEATNITDEDGWINKWY